MSAWLVLCLIAMLYSVEATAQSLRTDTIITDRHGQSISPYSRMSSPSPYSGTPSPSPYSRTPSPSPYPGTPSPSPYAGGRNDLPSPNR